MGPRVYDLFECINRSQNRSKPVAVLEKRPKALTWKVTALPIRFLRLFTPLYAWISLNYATFLETVTVTIIPGLAKFRTKTSQNQKKPSGSLPRERPQPVPNPRAGPLVLKLVDTNHSGASRLWRQDVQTVQNSQQGPVKILRGGSGSLLSHSRGSCAWTPPLKYRMTWSIPASSHKSSSSSSVFRMLETTVSVVSEERGTWAVYI